MQSINPPPNRSQQDFDQHERIELAAQMMSGVHWFYWIAALSLINTVISLFGAGIAFSLGLAFLRLVGALTVDLEGPARAAVVVVDLMCVGVFVVFGYLGTRQQSWAILVGTVLYVLDGLLLLGLLALGGGGSLILGVLIHGYATYKLILGFNACRRLAQLPLHRPGPPGPDAMSTMGQH